MKVTREQLEDSAHRYRASVPRDGRRGFYELVIEYEPPAPAAEQLAAAVEDALCRVNSNYEEDVATRTIAPIRVTYLPRGWFSELRRRLLDERGMQAKTPIFWTTERPAGWPTQES